jgi:pyruvate/2-oxoglutarate dehydrogenase complex dihydrolipoamide acyltransferase (E2) component
MDLCVPLDMWDDESEAVIVTWIYGSGAVVNDGEVLAEIMVSKASMEFVAPRRGRLTILAPAETIVRRGDVIGRLEPVE